MHAPRKNNNYRKCFCATQFCGKKNISMQYSSTTNWCWLINTLRPRQNGCYFADDTFKRIFLNQNVRNSIDISLKFVPKGRIHNIISLVHIMAWRRPGDKPLSEPTIVRLPTHICVTRPQWVKASLQWVQEHACWMRVYILTSDGLILQEPGHQQAWDVFAWNNPCPTKVHSQVKKYQGYLIHRVKLSSQPILDYFHVDP